MRAIAGSPLDRPSGTKRTRLGGVRTGFLPQRRPAIERCSQKRENRVSHLLMFVGEVGFAVDALAQPALIGLGIGDDRRSVGFAPSPIDLLADDGDRLLIDACGVPALNGSEVRLAGLIAGAAYPPMPFQKIGS